jgi:hypothetical protein
MDESTTAQTKKEKRKKPPLSPARIAGEILAGTATGFVVAVPVLYVTRCVVLHAIWGQAINLGHGDFVAVGLIFVAFPMLYGPASAVGVYLVGSRGNQMGSPLATLGCGYLAGFVILVTQFAALVLSDALPVGVETTVAWACWALLLLVAPIMAAICFNLTRRYKQPPSS